MFVGVRAPVSHPVAIKDLRPTQITLGYEEVRTRTAKLASMADQDGAKLLRKHIIPVVKGPKARFFIIDHHHLCRALLDAGSKNVLVTVVLNLERLKGDEFWSYLDHKALVHPFDEDGKRGQYGDIPKSVTEMRDDPFRSLAGAVRRRGGYAKDTTPFSEFLWADFLRRRLNREEVEKRFENALDAAYELARKPEADHLPGWCGPIQG
jgi:hypothetical protein